MQLLGPAVQSLASPGAATPADLADLKSHPEWLKLMRCAREVGEANDYPSAQSAILHDIRGGGLFVLLGTLQLFEPSNVTSEDVYRIYCYIRDHSKIMRNGVPELDPERAAVDLQPSAHLLRLVREKWTGSQVAVTGLVKEVQFESDFDGAISARCLEFGALDRVIYNFMNNALRHCAGNAVRFSVFSTGGADHPNVRLAFENEITAADEIRLAKLTGSNLEVLFRGGLSTTGGGRGLRNCAEFVTDAYGLASPDAVVAGSYVGARVISGKFVAWFHWPKL